MNVRASLKVKHDMWPHEQSDSQPLRRIVRREDEPLAFAQGRARGREGRRFPFPVAIGNLDGRLDELVGRDEIDLAALGPPESRLVAASEQGGIDCVLPELAVVAIAVEEGSIVAV